MRVGPRGPVGTVFSTPLPQEVPVSTPYTMCAMEVASSRTARSANYSAVAADLIREAILDGELPAGARLKEDELAERLDVSRTPVREALRRLEAEGLVVHEPKRGAAVRSYTPEELDDMYRLRALLEG